MKRSEPALPESEEDIGVIPAAFFGTVTAEAFKEMIERDGLNAEECARLWRMTDRHSEPPKFLRLLLKEADLERWLKTIAPAKRVEKAKREVLAKYKRKLFRP